MAFYPQSKSPPSALAISSLVLAACSVLMLCVGPLLSIPAIILGIAALPPTRREPSLRRGRGLAVTGIAVGAVSLLLSIGFFLLAPTLFSGWSPIAKLQEIANRSADLKNVATLIADARSYADENQGTFPPHLAALEPKLTTVRLLLSRTTKTTPPAIPVGTPWQDSTAEIDAHCDYLYIGADINLPTLLDPSQVIAIYSKDVYPDHGRLVGFADGHVVWTPAADLPAVFEQSNHQRTGSSLPAVFLDGPPPKPLVKTASLPGQATEPASTLPAAPPEIKTVADAAEQLRSSDNDRRLAAIIFLESAQPVPTFRPEVSQHLESYIAEPELRFHALSALKSWATKDNVPGLVSRLKTIKTDDMTEANAILGALGGTGDAPDTADILATYLAKDVSRRSAANALKALGPDAEPAVLFYLDSKDQNTAREACQVLAQIGTARSLPALKDVSPKNVALRREADAAIQSIQSRLPPPSSPP